MSRISKATSDKRQIINMLVGKGTGTQSDSNSGDVAIPDGAFPAFLHTSCVVQYESLPEDEAAQHGKDEKSQSPSRAGSPSSPRAPSKVITPGMIEDGEEDDYDKEVDQNEKERQKSEQRKSDNNRKASEEETENEEKEKKEILENQTARNVTTEIWTAEQDGSISVRAAATGRHVKGQPRVRRVAVGMGGVGAHVVGKGANKITTLHAKKDTSGSSYSFVTCMIQMRDVVFAGYQDGHLRAFNVYTKEMTFQKKKHAGCINALSSWNNENILFSASDDFRICMWKAGKEEGPDMKLKARRSNKESKNENGKKGATTVTAKPIRQNPESKLINTQNLSAYEENLAALDQPAPLHHLTGHVNRVLCMRVEGDFLFSGGDDGVVRCWDIHQRNEVVNSKGGVKCYPLFAHDGGVKDLTICEDVLFTAGRGGVSLWDIESCTLLHTFGDDVGGEFNKIAVNPTSLTLWACCATDGRVFLYDLFSFQQIGNPLDQFCAASIKTIQTVSSSLSSRLFLCNQDSGVTVVYAETSDTGMRPSYEPVTDQMRQEFECLDGLRQQLLSNDKLLREQRALLWYIRHTDEYHKECCADAMHRSRAEATKREFLEKSLVFLMKTRFRERQRVLAVKMEQHYEKCLILSMFLKWYYARRSSKDGFFREFVTNSLSRGTNRDLVASHLQNALTYLHNSQQEKRNQALSEMMEVYCYRKIQTVSFASWLRFVERAKRTRKLHDMVTFMANRTNMFALRQRYNTLSRYLSMMRDARMKIYNTTMLVRTNGRILLTVYFTAMREYLKRKRYLAQRVRYVIMAELNGSKSILQRYFMGKWVPLTRFRKQIAVSEAIKKMETKTQEMETIMNEVSNGALEHVDRQLDEVTIELEAAQGEVDNLKDGVGFLIKREQALMAEASIEPYEEKRALAVKYRNVLADDSFPLSMKGNTSFCLRNAKDILHSKKEDRRKRGLPSEFETYDATMKSLKPFSCNCNSDYELIIKHNKRYSCKAGTKTSPLSHKIADNFSNAVEEAKCQFETKFGDRQITADQLGSQNPEFLTDENADPFAKFEEHDTTLDESTNGVSNEWIVSANKICNASQTDLIKALSGIREALIIWDYVSHRLSQNPDINISLFVTGCTGIVKNLVPIRTAFLRENLLAVLHVPKVQKKRSLSSSKNKKKRSASPKGRASSKKRPATGTKAVKTKKKSSSPSKRTKSPGTDKVKKSSGRKTVGKPLKKL